MKRFFLFGCLFLVVVIPGCKKESSDPGTVYPVITPLSYLPVYPGSFWKYLLETDTLTSKTSDTLILFQDEYITSLDGDLIRQYKKFISYGMYNTGWVRILSEEVGLQFGYYVGDPRRWPSTYTYLVLQKMKDIHGDSILIQRIYKHPCAPPGFDTNSF